MSEQDKKPSGCDQLFDALWAADIVPHREYRFAEFKHWRFDLAYPTIKLAIEVDGHGYGHGTYAAIRRDKTKINYAIEMGWRVLTYPSKSCETIKRRQRIVDQINRAICGIADPESASIVLMGD